MLQLENVSCWYADDVAPVLYQFSTTVPAATIVGIVGESGGGKSTLLKLACGLLQLSLASRPEFKARLEGRVLFEGEPVSKPLAAFGYVPQNFQSSLAPWLSARDNVLLGCDDALAEAAMADDLLARTGLADVADLPVRSLSGGQQQRVAICRSLLRNPRVLFLDEPFANLDFALRPSINEFLRTLRTGKGLSIVAVTHDLQSALDSSDRLIVVRRGMGRPEYKTWIESKPHLAELQEWMTGVVV